MTSTRMIFTRRRFLGAGLETAGLAALFGWDNALANAQESLKPFNRFPRMVQEYFVQYVRQAERRNVTEKQKLKTREDAEAYVTSVRERIRRCFGPEPERTPLNARVTGVVERNEYRIEKVIFESRPGFLVTANLYVPKGKLPAPGVVGSCGHSANGKAAEAYQSFAQGLARLGYVCLIFDPIGQGERLQAVDKDLKPRIGTGTAEHLHFGNQQYLVGEFFGMWRAWDGIRALDYLLTREEVDKNHVGITGNSGGGTMTTWLCGVEPRWTMAAPACFVTTFRRNLENELPQDTEQCPPNVLALGLDHDDFLAALAPKPVIILAKERDYFDVRGAEEAYERLRRLYRLFDAEDKVSLFVGPTTHGYSQENREAMYRWFNGVTGISEAKSEPKLVIEKDETLWCTPKGQVADLSSKTIFDFTRAKAEQLPARRRKLSDKELAQAVRLVLRIPMQQPPTPEYRILRYLNRRKYPLPHAMPYAVDTEPGIQAIVYRLYKETWFSRPPKAQKRAILYVAHRSSDVELREEPLIAELVKAEPESGFYTIDVRGIGESMPQTCGVDTFDSEYGCDYFYAAHSLMIGRPYLGQKVYDVLRVLDWLQSLGHEEVHLVGKGWGALAATFAGLLSDLVKQVTVKDALESYAKLATTEEYHYPLAALPPNILQFFDLPDCYAALKEKSFRNVDLV